MGKPLPRKCTEDNRVDNWLVVTQKCPQFIDTVVFSLKACISFLVNHPMHLLFSVCAMANGTHLKSLENCLFVYLTVIGYHKPIHQSVFSRCYDQKHLHPYLTVIAMRYHHRSFLCVFLQGWWHQPSRLLFSHALIHIDNMFPV